MSLIDELRQKTPALQNYSDAEIASALRQKPQFKDMPEADFQAQVRGRSLPSAEKEAPGFGAGFSAGVDQLQAMGGGLVMAAGEKLDSEGMWNAGRDIYADNMAEANENALGYGFTDLFSDPETSAMQWASYTAGNLLPMMATSIATGGVGGAAAGAGAKMLAGNVAKQAATRAGQAVGAYAGSAGMETGAIMGEVENADVALAHGSIAGALDALPIMRVLRKTGGDELAGKAADEISTSALRDLRRNAGRTVKGSAGRGALTQTIAEASTEGLQGLIGQHASYWVDENASLLNNFGDVDWLAMIDEGAAGGLMGGIMGAPSGVVERNRANSALSNLPDTAGNQEAAGDNASSGEDVTLGDAAGPDWDQYDIPPAQRKAQAAEQARAQAAAQGGDALDQAMAGQQAEQSAATEPDATETDPAALGNRIQMARDAAGDLERQARDTDQGEARLRNLKMVLDRAESQYDSGNMASAERLAKRAEVIARNLTGAISRSGSRENPAQGVWEQTPPFGGLLGNDGPQARIGSDGNVIRGEGPIADQTQYDPQARSVRRDEGLAAQRQGAERMREQQANARPQLADQGIQYGSGPVAGNANTGLDQPVQDPRFTDTGARQQAEDSRVRQQRAADAAAEVARTRGQSETAYLPDNTPVATRFRVMDLAEVTPSNSADGQVNPDYPQELQPRDRTNANSQVQVRNIASRLNPERLGSSSDASSGAPILGADGVVESGNGRTMAIEQAYRANGQQAQAYRDFVRQEAAAQGMDPTAVDAMQRPVLVRERTSNIDRADFARRANESQVAGMTAYEQAQADADVLTADDLKVWAPDQSGDPLAASNRAFQRRFVQQLGNNDAARYTTRDGQASPELGQRMQRAMFAKGYQDADMVEMATEQGDQMRNLTAALQVAAPDLAMARETGNQEALDAIGTINDAVRLLRNARQGGMSVRELARQSDAFTAPVPETTALLAIGLNSNLRSRPALTEAMRYIGQSVRQRAESSRNGALFEDTTTNEDVFNAALQSQDQRAPQRSSEGDVQPGTRRSQSSPAEGGQVGAAQGPAEGQQTEALRGEPLDDEWTAFSEASGTQGIPRAEMPQIKAEHRGAFANFLSARGIESTEETVSALSLHPTQREFSEERVQVSKDREGGDRAILVSADRHVVDGHHQWMARADEGGDVRVIRLDAPIDQVLEAARDFPSSEVDNDAPLLATYDEQELAERDQVQQQDLTDAPQQAEQTTQENSTDNASAGRIKWERRAKNSRVWIGSNGMRIADQGFSSGGNRIPMFMVFADNDAFGRGENLATFDTLAEAKREAPSLVAQDTRQEDADANEASTPKRRNKPLEYTGYSGQERRAPSYKEVGDYRIAKVNDGLYEVIDSDGQAVSQMAGPSGAVAEARRLIEGGEAYSLSDAGRPARGGDALRADDITAALEGIEELGDAKVIQSARDLPETALIGMALRGVNPADVRGMYIGGELYVIADNLESVQEGIEVAVHEAVGHKGMRGVLGEDLDRVMLDLHRSLSNSKQGRAALAEVRRDYPFLDPKKREDRVTIGEEMVAHLLEKGVRPNAWQKAVAKIRELLRRAFPMVGWTYTDVLALGEKSRDYLRRQLVEADREAEPRYSVSLRGDTDLSARDLAARLREEHEGLKLDLMGSGDVVTVSRIVVPQDARETGVGTEVMRRITDWADANSKTLALTPSGDFGGSKRRLQSFYKRLGFEDNKGSARDYAISESMYRLPEGSDGQLYSLRAKRRTAFEDQFGDFNATDRQAASKIGSRTPPQRAMDWFKEKSNRAGLKIRQGMVDQNAALKEMDEKLYGETTLTENIQRSSWVLARMSNAANGALHAMLHNGRIRLDPKEKVIQMQDGESAGLGSVLGRLGSAAEIERFMGWIAGNRSDRLAKEGKENLFEADEIAAMKAWNRGKLEDGSSREQRYQEVFEEFQQYRDDVLAVAEQSGIISSDQREMWAEEFYVPFYRLSEEKGAPTGQVATSGLSRQQAYKRLKGGTQNLNDLLQNSMLNFHHLLDASLKNQAATQAVENAKQLGMAERVPESNRDTKTSTFVMEGGQKVFYQIDDPMVFQALTALASPGMNSTMMKVLRAFKRVFTNTVTVTPQFVAANLIRDSIQATATNDVSKNALGNVLMGSRSLRDEKIRAQMMASGASFNFGNIYGSSPDELRAQMSRGMRDAKIIAPAGSFLPPGLSHASEAVRGGWAWWNDVNNHFENVNRAAIYTQNREGGELRAAFEARDLIDFSAHGAWPAARILIDVVPFLNARIQGLDKIYRSGVKPGASVLNEMFGRGKASVTDKQAAGRFWAVTGAVTMATVALYLHNQDDEEYQALEEWERDSYWHLFFGENKFAIPKPFEVGAIATMAERITEQFVDDQATGKLFAERMMHMMTDTFSFSPVPQAVQPALDIYANYDAFTQRPIESMGMDRLSPELRRRASTSKLATGISQVLNSTVGAIGNSETNPLALSPIQVDHLIEGYFGAVGGWVAGGTDVAVRTLQGEEAPAKRWYEYQPVRRFYSNLGDVDPYTKYGTVFYEGLREAGRAYSDLKELREMGRLAEVAELVESKREMFALRTPLNRAQSRLSQLNKRIDIIRRSNLDGELKRQRIDRIQAIKAQTQRALGERVMEARVN